jgi:hypothetical protein
MTLDDRSEVRLKEFLQRGWSLQLALSVMQGKMSEPDASRAYEVSLRAIQLYRTPRSRWPSIDVSWDLCPKHFHLALDGLDAGDFAESFNTACVCWVDMDELQGALNSHSARTDDPFHRNYKSKTSKLVAHLEYQGVVTPPFIRIMHDGLGVVGGNHRLGWAEYQKQKSIPIIILAVEIMEMRSLLPSLKPHECEF